MGKIDKINRTVLSEEIKSDLDSKATKTELLNVKAELENQINNVVSNLVRKPSVPTYNDLFTTYPNPKEGWTVSVDDTNITYQYDEDSGTWIKTSINAIPKATSELDGLLTKEDKAKLDTIQPYAEPNKTTSQILNELKTIDGHGSDLDADLLDGKHASDFASATHDHDGRYYTQTQLNTMLAGKSDVTHTHNLTVNGDVSGSVTLNNTSKTLSLTLNNTGVTSGTYTKVTVDSKGRVTTGQSLSASDIPNLDWSKITTGKPTTLAGYGITDAIPSSQKGVANGIAPLDVNGKIPDSYISSTFVKQSQLGNAGYGDMTKSIYDTDNDGIVDRAEVANSVDWNNIQNKPTTFTPSSHTHNWSEINNKPTTLSGYGISDAVNSFSLPANGSSTSYVKIAELTTNIGAGENGLILYLNGVSDLGNNMPGVDVLQVSTRGSVNLKVYRLIPSGTNDVSYGYVNNGSTGKTEIWLKRDAYNYGVNIIVANARNATYGNLLTQDTEPSGIVYVTKESIALTTDNVSTASKLQTARTISLTGDSTGSVSFDGSANVNIVTTLSNTGVVSGIYTKVTVDSKGRITAGSTLSESDIPNLDWSKIYNKPLLINGVVSSTEPLNPSTNLIWIDTN